MPRRPQPTDRSRLGSRGVSLLEVMATMVVLGVALIFLTQALVQESFVERRTSSQVAGLRLLEAHSEIVRAGLPLPATDGEYAMDLLVSPPAGAGLDEIELRLKLKELNPEGLWRVDLLLSYRVAGNWRSQNLEMRLWRP